MVGGSNPTYQWTVNGNPSGSGFVTFTTSALNDGDIVKVAMTSSAVCPFPATVNSNPIVMNVISTVIPDVTISANVVWPICDGTPVTFNASVVNGGPVPAFNWQINGVNTGTNSPALTIANLVDGDSIKVRLVSNATCANPVVVFRMLLLLMFCQFFHQQYQ
ncbi:MAG: hypothetical protein IPP71_21030 [Bacteroidetes bacterium]|nr:hypothetical protein [Bacteroidota bacterium]